MDAQTRIANRFLVAHPQDAARLCESLPPADVAELLCNVPVAAALAILQHLTPAVAADSVPLVPADRGASLLESLPADLAAGILRRIPQEKRAPILAAMPEKKASSLAVLLHYPAHTAGALMDPAVLSLPSDIHANEARNLVRRSTHHILYYLYVVDRAHRLVGVLDLRELLLADPHELLSSIMKAPVAHLSARADQTAILAHPGWRSWHALPVVDENEVLLGMLRYDTFRRLEEAAAPNLKLREALGLALGVGEMYWIVAAQLITSLSPPPEGAKLPGRETDGSKPNANG